MLSEVTRPRIFSTEADATIEEAFRWLAARLLVPVEPVVVYRAHRQGATVAEADHVVLREMAKHSGWIERGGQAIGARSTFDESRGIASREEMGARTSWLGQPEWARSSGYDKAAICAIVEKAIAGERLGSREIRLFQAMLDVLAENEANKCPF